MPTLDRRGFIQGCGAACAAAGLSNGAWAVDSRLPAAEGRQVAFADGGMAPRLGLGSWHMASPGAAPEAQAVETMRLGVSLGLDLIDTAELYSDGRAEQMVAKVLAGQRDKVFLVSKIMPDHATEDGIDRALRASLARLGTDHLDLYLLHWRKRRRERLVDTLLFRDGDLKGVVRGFERAREQGLIKRWGVSNFGVSDMEELVALPGGERCATNQILYNLHDRGVEADVIPWCQKHKMPIMAYSPLGAGGKAALLAAPALKTVADARGATPAAVALAWTMRDGRTIVVTETSSSKHVRENAAALTLTLNTAELKALDESFPPAKAS